MIKWQNVQLYKDVYIWFLAHNGINSKFLGKERKKIWIITIIIELKIMPHTHNFVMSMGLNNGCQHLTFVTKMVIKVIEKKQYHTQTHTLILNGIVYILYGIFDNLHQLLRSESPYFLNCRSCFLHILMCNLWHSLIFQSFSASSLFSCPLYTLTMRQAEINGMLTTIYIRVYLYSEKWISFMLHNIFIFDNIHTGNGLNSIIPCEWIQIN